MHFDPGDAPPGAELTQLQRVARATARTVPRIMGTLSAGFRDRATESTPRSSAHS